MAGVAALALGAGLVACGGSGGTASDQPTTTRSGPVDAKVSAKQDAATYTAWMKANKVLYAASAAIHQLQEAYGNEDLRAATTSATTYGDAVDRWEQALDKVSFPDHARPQSKAVLAAIGVSRADLRAVAGTSSDGLEAVIDTFNVHAAREMVAEDVLARALHHLDEPRAASNLSSVAFYQWHKVQDLAGKRFAAAAGAIDAKAGKIATDEEEAAAKALGAGIERVHYPAGAEAASKGVQQAAADLADVYYRRLGGLDIVNELRADDDGAAIAKVFDAYNALADALKSVASGAAPASEATTTVPPTTVPPAGSPDPSTTTGSDSGTIAGKGYTIPVPQGWTGSTAADGSISLTGPPGTTVAISAPFPTTTTDVAAVGQATVAQLQQQGDTNITAPNTGTVAAAPSFFLSADTKDGANVQVFGIIHAGSLYTLVISTAAGTPPYEGNSASSAIQLGWVWA